MDISNEHLEIRRKSGRAINRAQDVYDQLLLAYSFIGYHEFSVGHHWKLAQDSFKDLAECLGYRVEKIEGEAEQPLKHTVITEREVYSSELADALTLGFSQRESL